MPAARYLKVMAPSSDEEIRWLKSKLYQAQSAVIELMPGEIERMLYGFYSCESRDEGVAWKEKVTESLIELASSSAAPETAWGEHRANCPLCNRGSYSAYQEGFSLPEGLRRHLVGWGKNRRCVVMEVVSNMANDHWNEKFSAAEQEAWQADQGALAKRRKTEMLYRTSPYGDAKLLDEDSNSWAPSRTPEQLAWAEARLKFLGFLCVSERNTQSWVDEKDDYVVYADPRVAGKISFEVWRKPLPKRLKASSRLHHINKSFQLLDSWKNNLPSKYAERVAQGLSD